MTVSDAPTSELGHPGVLAPILGTDPTGGAVYYVDGLDVNPDLRFPASTVVYDRMRKEDGQVGSVMRSIVLGITGANRRLTEAGVRPEVRAFIANELGLNLSEDQARARRRRQGVVLTDHLREAALCLVFGFMPFEQVYDVDVAAPGLEDPDAPGRLFAHLRKLAPRMPRSLQEVRVARDGGLVGIVQEPPPAARGQVATRGVFIPVDRLVMYVHDREGADWTGNSVLRSAYKHWLIKDALIRLGAQIVERNGMGVPVVTVDGPEHRAKGLGIAKAFRAGATAGVVLEPGIRSVDLVGVSGATADELPRVKYHDESIGRSLLAMVLNLGHDNGARALGETLLGIFRDFLNSINRGLDEVITEHIIRDLVELNYGPEEPYPTLVTEDLTEELAAEALKQLADAGLIVPDEQLEAHLRRRYGLPAIDQATRPQPVAGELAPIPDGDATDDGGIVIPYDTAASGDLVDRLAALTDRLAALRVGHGA